MSYEGYNRRENFRLIYPCLERPQLIYADYKYNIVDISIGGIKYIKIDDISYSIKDEFGKIIKARIEFKEGDLFDFQGEILRYTDKETIIFFPDLEEKISKGIPGKIITKEQRYLIRNGYRNYLLSSQKNDF